MPITISADSSSPTAATTKARAKGLADSFDEALGLAVGKASDPGVISGRNAISGTTQNPRSQAQEDGPTRKPRDAKQQDLTQISVAELSAIPTAGAAASEELKSPGSDEPLDEEAAPAAARNERSKAQGAAGRNEVPADSGEEPEAERASGAEPPRPSVRDGPKDSEPAPATDAPEASDGATEIEPGVPQKPSPTSSSPGTRQGVAVVAPVARAPASGAPAEGSPPGAPATGEVKTITGAKSKALLASLESSARGKFVVEDDEPVTQVTQGLTLALRQGGKATLRLNPESLGELTIHLKVHGESVSARIEPTTESARHLLETKSHELWAALEARGLSVERIEIDGSRIGQQLGASSQDANHAPNQRPKGEPNRRGTGAEPRAIDTESFDSITAPSGVDGVWRSTPGHRLRLDALA